MRFGRVHSALAPCLALLATLIMAAPPSALPCLCADRQSPESVPQAEESCSSCCCSHGAPRDPGDAPMSDKLPHHGTCDCPPGCPAACCAAKVLFTTVMPAATSLVEAPVLRAAEFHQLIHSVLVQDDIFRPPRA